MKAAGSTAQSQRDDALAASSAVSQPSTHDSQPPRIPDHELLRPIASGAYGDVWLARSIVGTLRAVKIVRRDRHATAESFEREFKGLQKFEPVSRTHDGLVDILTLGLLADGAGFYYVMELADPEGRQKAECRMWSQRAAPNPILHSAFYLLPWRTMRPAPSALN